MAPKSRPFYDARADAKAEAKERQDLNKAIAADARAEARDRQELKKAMAERAKIKKKKVKVPQKERVIINIGGTFNDSELLRGYAAFAKGHGGYIDFIGDIISGTRDKREFEESCKKIVSYVMYFPEEFLKNKEYIAGKVRKNHYDCVASEERDNYMKFMVYKHRGLATTLEIHVHDPAHKGGLVAPQSDHPHLKALDGREMKLTFQDLAKLAKEAAAAREAYTGFEPQVPAF